PLPPRNLSTSNPFTEFSGGGYFYLDQRDRAVIPTTNDQIWVVGETSSPAGPAFSLERTYDVSAFMSSGDQIISALPDWSGRLWDDAQPDGGELRRDHRQRRSDGRGRLPASQAGLRQPRRLHRAGVRCGGRLDRQLPDRNRSLDRR